MNHSMHGRLRRREEGQAMVEFSLAIVLFLALTLGVVDTSRAVFDLHGLSRTAESIAHQLALRYATSGGYAISSGDAAMVIQAAHTASDISFSTAEPLTLDITHSTYQEMNNGSVYICAGPNFASAQVIVVTVVGMFQPVSTLFIGGRNVSLAERVTVLTYAGEQNGSDYHAQCPTH